MNNIEELKKVALAATPGPWEKCDSYGPNENGTCISAVERPDLMIASTTGYYGRVGGIANTHFIALANPAVILDLIAQLEAAQKESAIRMEAIEQMRKTVAHNVDRAQKAETALSAANEKLSKPVVLPEMVVVNISGKYPIEVMYASKVKTFIKAAGFTVEGE
ncbi:ead/Ea22-like family protein [Yersinia enterocolitica]